ncbi:RabGAP/TBC [Myriangium duriaei CBS 260.36]|uniref:GTPase-activating protein GYP5 n=1 Tax=Myriangium duriaei CBS 260.36 TaxID=1168546 RepID=A0A9P4J2E7_9PEZI|nr:RabGAP/TBC [Myriangium duriaei CBS 260.36]
MADHSDENSHPPQTAAASEQPPEEHEPTPPSTESEQEPFQDATEEQGHMHSRKIAVDGMENMSLEDVEAIQNSKSTSDLLESAPTLSSETAPSVEVTQSPVAEPTKTENAVSPLPSPSALPSEDSDRPSAPSRTISEGLSKKMTTGFSWFTRAANRGKPATSPPPQTQSGSGFPSFGTRRGTNSSVSTLASHTDRTLPAIKDDHEGGFGRAPTLQDRFQALRMEEEARDGSDHDQTPPAENPSKNPMSNKTTEAGSDGAPVSPNPTDSVRKLARAPTTLNAKLPPGTAAGIAMGPSTEDEGPVDWDLWQNLVCEGPAAVAKTSGQELNAAIQSGIPAPIRGVVWQILADSKSEHLEIVYRSLVGKDEVSGLKSPALSRGESANYINAGEKESLASSASSIRSHSSTPATSTNAASPPPTTLEHPNDEEEKNLALPRKKSADQTASIQKLEKQIRKDLGARTAYSKYIASQGLQEGLFGVCKAYALFDESIGYAQGMNFIAMPLLFNMPEEEAFSLFVRMMSKYDLRSMFTPEMTGLHLRLYQFERLLEDFEPALYCHLHRRGVTPTLYATQWFLTLFAYRFPLQLVQRIYDLILSDGLSAILKFGIVLMRKNAQALLGMNDMAQLTTFLKEKLFDVYIDKSPSASSILDSGFFGLAGGVDKEVYHADALVRDACAIDISDKTLSQYQAEFEEKTRTEKEREAELENLRVSNTKLSSKLRNLEARVEQQDSDHVGIASELIRTKVDNEALSDANESLKMQVEELRKVVEHQPAEVEERLKEEMQRIMARNMEVQNSNRALEDSMQEMEQELVGTKMQYAQLNAEFEDLKQKLSNIQQLLGGGGAAAAAAAAVSPSGGR